MLFEERGEHFISGKDVKVQQKNGGDQGDFYHEFQEFLRQSMEVEVVGKQVPPTSRKGVVFQPHSGRKYIIPSSRGKDLCGRKPFINGIRKSVFWMKRLVSLLKIETLWGKWVTWSLKTRPSENFPQLLWWNKKIARSSFEDEANVVGSFCSQLNLSYLIWSVGGWTYQLLVEMEVS